MQLSPLTSALSVSSLMNTKLCTLAGCLHFCRRISALGCQYGDEQVSSVLVSGGPANVHHQQSLEATWCLPLLLKEHPCLVSSCASKVENPWGTKTMHSWKISLLQNHSVIWTEIERMLSHQSWDLGLSHTILSNSILVSIPKYRIPLSPSCDFPYPYSPPRDWAM